MLKTTIAILFTITYLFTVTQLSELLKLPVMAEHFVEHKRENPKITLWEFMCIHYAHGEVNDDDFDKDMKLPFKSHSFCSCSSITFCQPVINYDLSKKNLSPTSLKSKANFGYHFSFSTNFLSSIWQPPKVS